MNQRHTSPHSMAMMNITFEFVGGPNDGKVVEGGLGEAGPAERLFLFSNRGKIGQRFKVASDYAVEMLAAALDQGETSSCFPAHYYVVTDRLEDRGDVWVRVEYARDE